MASLLSQDFRTGLHNGILFAIQYVATTHLPSPGKMAVVTEELIFFKFSLSVNSYMQSLATTVDSIALEYKNCF